MRLMILVALLSLVSCATKYKPEGLSGGFSEQKMATDIYKVSFAGNGYTSSRTVENFLIKRCAELTLLSGYTHFIFLERNDSADVLIKGNSSSISTTNRHLGEATIKMISNPVSSMNAYDAEMIFGSGPKRKTAALPKWEKIDQIIEE